MDRHELEELSMLADGSLPAGRRAEVEARIAASPAASSLLENERRAVAALRATSALRAPEPLRERIAEDRARARRAPAPRRRTVLAGAFAGALAVLALAIVLVLPGGTPASPSFSQAASLAQRGPNLPAPPAARGATSQYELARHVDNVQFPSWAALRAAAIGERVDRLDGRLARTVYYTTASGVRVAYTIVAGPALAEPTTGTITDRHGVWLRSLRLEHRLVVTWRRGGHTCIVSATDASAQSLLRLASWEHAV
jgi:anti-sigma factor RsiW